MGEVGPAQIVPTPAAQVARLRGLRVIVGVPGVGFRGDLRADNPVVQGSRTFVPVLTEQDYYRAETDQVEVFAPLVPIERVWVEEVSAGRSPDPPASLDAPPHQEPVPALLEGRTMGRRMVQSVPDGHVRDLRAVTDVYLNAAGAACVRVCPEQEWYRWALSGAAPSTVESRAEGLWVE